MSLLYRRVSRKDHLNNMKIINTQKNKGHSYRQAGFTLIETMIAVFILALALSTLLGLISKTLFLSRYAKNDIVANYLMQETIDYIRNDRDTIAFQKVGDIDGGWNTFLSKYGYSTSGMCFSKDGCEIEPSNVSSDNINLCDTSHTNNFGTIDCKLLNYDETGSDKSFYNYQSTGKPSNFKRRIRMEINPTINNSDELDVEVTVEWLNGNVVKSRSSTISLLNWQK